MSRALGLGPTLALALGLGLIMGSGCKANSQVEAESGSEQAKAKAALPADEAAFLALLLPLPEGAAALELHYRVEGPALDGTMDVALGPGGLRRDRWELRSKAGDTFLRAAGSRVVTPEKVWTGAAGQAGKVHDNHLGGLARAYLARDDQARAKLVESIEAWHATLAEQRAGGGEQAEILGVSCLRTRVAGQNVCMWEEAGVLLDYEGSAFSIEAEEIDRAPELADDTFSLPAVSSQAERVEAPAPDYDAILDDIAAGSYASLAKLVYANAAMPELEL